MPTELSRLESVLFVASKPLTLKRLAETVGLSAEETLEHLRRLQERYRSDDSGLSLLEAGDEWQLVSLPDNRDVTERFVKDELAGELTKAQLETLTVIAYAGPISKPELEQIRGVNCALIIRNLLMRGLIKEGDEGLLPTYTVTIDYLRHIGMESVTDLPRYEELHNHTYLHQALEKEVVQAPEPNP